MKRVLIVLLLFPFCKLFAQNNTLADKVTDDRGLPISGASIIIKNTLLGTITDAAGLFSIRAIRHKLPVTLLVSAINYPAKEVEIITFSSPMSISMGRETASSLNEVVTTASRVPENILQSPVSIEKMTSRVIRENPALPFMMACNN